MLTQILALFPPHTHPLTLVSDPDAVLDDAAIVVRLMERGFRLITENDPITLRAVVQQAQPFTADAPGIIVTAGTLETLPYDLWQQGYHLTLALHQLFPNLDYIALRELNPTQRQRLSDAQATLGTPEIALAYRESREYLLRTGITPALDRRIQQFTESVAWLEQQPGELRWAQWQLIAWRWAQISLWRTTPDLQLPPDQRSRFQVLQTRLDAHFLAWMQSQYAPLATRALPIPHHLHHIPGWLAYQRQQHADQRSALIVMDGMSLADWLQIRAVWQARHRDWQLDEQLVLAQVPSITAISRQALISGQRPASFAETLQHNRYEAQHWAHFWQTHGLPAEASAYAHLASTWDAAYPDVIVSRRVQTVCLVSSVIDEKVHSESQGAIGWQATLGVWLHANDGQHQSVAWLEGLIKHLFNLRYTVVVTSDHGHVEARGMGTPQEGVLVESRSKRARIYRNPAMARIVQLQFADTILWENDGILPAATQVLIPHGRRAFAPVGDLVLSHGGLTMEEMVVPLITITQS